MNRNEAPRTGFMKSFLFFKNEGSKRLRHLIRLAVALAIMLALIGKNLPLPWHFSEAAEDVLTDKSGEAGRLIIDRNESRGLLLDPDGHIIQTVENSLFSSDRYSIVSGMVTADSFYLVKTYEDEFFVSQDQVVRYNRNGSSAGVVASILPPYEGLMRLS